MSDIKTITDKELLLMAIAVIISESRPHQTPSQVLGDLRKLHMDTMEQIEKQKDE